MKRDVNASRTEVGRRTEGDAARKAWQAPRLTTIGVEDAQAMVTFASDGLYAVS